jgi:hypothetical protein
MMDNPIMSWSLGEQLVVVILHLIAMSQSLLEITETSTLHPVALLGRSWAYKRYA